MVHVGIDLDKRSSQIAVLTEDGEVVQQRLPNEVAGLEKFFGQLPPHTPIAIEASGTWWWLVDLLERLGHDPILSHPKQTKAIAAARLRTTASMPSASPCCSAVICCPRSGSRPRPCAKRASSFGIAFSSSGSAA